MNRKNSLFYNASGCADPTAFKAICDYQKGEKNMELKRGEIFEYKTLAGWRTAIVVSANERAKDKIQSIILLTSEAKLNYVPVVAKGLMYANCGMVSYAERERFGEFIRTASSKEVEAIDEGILKNLGIVPKVKHEVKEVKVQDDSKFIEAQNQLDSCRIELNACKKELLEYVSKKEEPSEELMQAKAEASVYKNLYETLLEKVIK